LRFPAREAATAAALAHSFYIAFFSSARAAVRIWLMAATKGFDRLVVSEKIVGAKWALVKTLIGSEGGKGAHTFVRVRSASYVRRTTTSVRWTGQADGADTPRVGPIKSSFVFFPSLPGTDLRRHRRPERHLRFPRRWENTQTKREKVE